MKKITLTGPGENALHQLQDTQLSPMEEALFRSWTKANQIDKPDNVDDPIDYRGIYRLTGGKVLPFGQLKQITKRVADQQRVKKELMEQARQMEQSEEDQINQLHKEQRQDITHQQKLEQQSMQLAKMPYDLQAQQIKNQGKVIDVEGKKAMADAQKSKTEQQLINALIPRTQPAGATYNASPERSEPIGASLIEPESPVQGGL